MAVPAGTIIAQYVIDYPGSPVSLLNGYVVEGRARRTGKEWLAYHVTDGCQMIEFRATNWDDATEMIDHLLRVAE